MQALNVKAHNLFKHVAPVIIKMPQEELKIKTQK